MDNAILINDLLKAIEYERSTGEPYYYLDSSKVDDYTITYDELEVGSIFRYRDTIYMKILPRHISSEVEVNAIYIAGANKPMYEYFEPKRLYCTYTYELDRS